MLCETVRGHLDPFLNNKLPDETGLEISRHLESCAACSRLFEIRKRVKDALRRAVENDPAPITLLEHIRRQIRRADHCTAL